MAGKVSSYESYALIKEENKTPKEKQPGSFIAH
jgi:hypothetical protein